MVGSEAIFRRPRRGLNRFHVCLALTLGVAEEKEAIRLEVIETERRKHSAELLSLFLEGERAKAEMT